MDFNINFDDFEDTTKKEQTLQVSNTEPARVQFIKTNNNIAQLQKDLQDTNYQHLLYSIFSNTEDIVKRLIKTRAGVYFIDNNYKALLDKIDKTKPIMIHCIGFGPEIIPLIKEQEFIAQKDQIKTLIQLERMQTIYNDTFKQPEYVAKQTVLDLAGATLKPSNLICMIYNLDNQRIVIKQYDYNEDIIQQQIIRFF